MKEKVQIEERASIQVYVCRKVMSGFFSIISKTHTKFSSKTTCIEIFQTFQISLKDENSTNFL